MRIEESTRLSDRGAWSLRYRRGSAELLHGGGYHSESSDRVKVDIPAECVPDTGEVAVFNTRAQLTILDG